MSQRQKKDDALYKANLFHIKNNLRTVVNLQ